MRCVFLDWEQITVSWKAFELCPQGSESNALTAYNMFPTNVQDYKWIHILIKVNFELIATLLCP